MSQIFVAMVPGKDFSIYPEVNLFFPSPYTGEYWLLTDLATVQIEKSGQKDSGLVGKPFVLLSQMLLKCRIFLEVLWGFRQPKILLWMGAVMETLFRRHLLRFAHTCERQSSTLLSI